MELTVKLQVFEGPLDLLLHLLEKNKVNIYDIPIAMITEQYMEYVNQMDKEDLNVVSEFLVMAATLLDIKSRMLLPKEVNEEGEEEEGEVVILKLEDTDEDSDEESYVGVDDEEILNKVFQIFKEKYKDDFNFVDED